MTLRLCVSVAEGPLNDDTVSVIGKDNVSPGVTWLRAPRVILKSMYLLTMKQLRGFC